MCVFICNRVKAEAAKYSHLTDGDGGTRFLRVAIAGWLDVIHRHVDLLTNQLLAKVLPCFKHVGDVVQRPDTPFLQKDSHIN